MVLFAHYASYQQIATDMVLIQNGVGSEIDLGGTTQASLCTCQALVQLHELFCGGGDIPAATCLLA